MSENVTPEQIDEALQLVRLLAEAAGQSDIHYMRKCLGTDHFDQARRLVQRIDGTEPHGVFEFDIDSLSGWLDGYLDDLGHTGVHSKAWLDSYLAWHCLTDDSSE